MDTFTSTDHIKPNKVTKQQLVASTQQITETLNDTIIQIKTDLAKAHAYIVFCKSAVHVWFEYHVGMVDATNKE